MSGLVGLRWSEGWCIDDCCDGIQEFGVGVELRQASMAFGNGKAAMIYKIAMVGHGA